MLALYILNADLCVDFPRTVDLLFDCRALANCLVHLNQACVSVGIFGLFSLSKKAFNWSIDGFVCVLFGTLQHILKLVPRSHFVQH